MTDHVTIGLTSPEGPGGAPVVVLAHSLGTGPLIWEQVVPLLAETYQVSLMTMPGHGTVPVPEAPFTMDDLADSVAEAVRGLGAGPVYFAGVSIGGALAFTLAIRHPELLRAVVPIAALAVMGDAAHWGNRAAQVREQSTSVLVADSAARWFAPGSIEKEPVLTGRILHVLQDTPDEGYARCAEALGTYDVTAQVGNIDVPVLAVAGEHDPVAPLEQVEQVARQIPGARSATIVGAGHQPPAEQSTRVFQTLDQFFKEIS